MATEKDLNRNDVYDLFTAAVASTSDFFQKPLKEEQRECIRRMVYLKEDIRAVYTRENKPRLT